MGTSKLGNMLVEDGLLSESDRRTIKRTCGTGGSAFARGILAMGLLDEDELAAYIAEHTSWRVAAKNLLETVQSGAWGCVDRPLVEQLEVLPVRLAGDTLHVAMIDPLDLDTISQLEFFSGYKILPIIATMTQVRAGLLRFIPDYQVAHSQLEDFLKNHSLTASKRVRMADESLYDDEPTPGSFSVKSFDDNATFTPPVREPFAPGGSLVADEDEDDIEFSVNDGSDIETVSNANFASNEETVEDIDLNFQEESPTQDDDLFAMDEESFSESGGPVSNNIELEDFGTDDSDDNVFGDPMLEPDVDLQVEPSAQSSPPEGEDLEDLMDLSSFDPDKTISDDDLDMGFDTSPKTPAKQPIPAVDIDSALELESSVNIEANLSGDLSDEINADFSDLDDSNISTDELFAESDNLLPDEKPGVAVATTSVHEEKPLNSSFDNESALEVDLDAELSADFSTMTSEDSDDLDIDSLADSEESPQESLSADETDFSFDSDGEDAVGDSTAVDMVTELDNESPIDALSLEDVDDLLDETPPPSFHSVAAATNALLEEHDGETVLTSGTTPQNLSMNINKMFFQVSMANETKSAIGAIASDLKATGFSTGMIIGGTANSQFRPECGWQDSQSGNQQPTTAAALQDKGIAAALGRLPSAWTALDDAVRGGDLKIFASLQRDNRKLFGIKFSNSQEKTDTVIVTAMAAEISENESLMQMAADLFKQVAAKNRGAA